MQVKIRIFPTQVTCFIANTWPNDGALTFHICTFFLYFVLVLLINDEFANLCSYNRSTQHVHGNRPMGL